MSLSRSRLACPLRSRATPSRLQAVAAWWALLRAEDGAVIDKEGVDAIVGDLAVLVGSARWQNQGV
ncbi:hypothetical protein [Streptomyces candidus]|uniref:Uncharacterized protein n=1 Tax=Streptomyces candidus TaxID=67283 RepID=A0A7X0LNW2_9ACTN|nr:hypothetical protein [Streptomyces candidus]MBB6435913.1 hypothetical protein [Streptomyces candidus]GHH42946.1 hypothetical protein GCM10018773_28140 [Streptomyces candidus]